MTLSILPWHLKTGSSLDRRYRKPGTVLSGSVIVLSSLAGGMVFPLSHFGRAMPSSASKEWLALLAISSALLIVLAVGYARLLRTRVGIPDDRSLFWAALCHIPLLACLSLVVAVYGNDTANHVFSRSPFGELIFQPVAQASVILTPITAQAMVLAAYRWKATVKVLPLVGITLGALGLRVWNLNWALPALYHPDEHIYLSRAMVMLSTGDLDPHYFLNPSLLIYLEYLLDRVLPQQAQAFRVINDFLGLGIQDPRWDYLVDVAARGISTITGTLTIPVVYWTGKELVNRKVGLIAASLLAVSFLHVRDSHYATNDILATFFLSASLLFSAKVYKRGRLNDYLLAGIFGGLGTASKYNVGVFCVAILLAHLNRTRKHGISVVSLDAISPLIASAIASLGTFLLGTPYALLDFSRFANDFRTQLGFGAEVWPGQDSTWSGFQYVTTLVQGFGLVPLALAILGAILLAKHDRPAFSVLLSVPTVYLLSMFASRLFFARFAIPVLPPLALSAGYAIFNSPNLVGRRLARHSRLLLIVAALAQPLTMSWQHDSLLGARDTRTLAADWIDDNAPPDVKVATEIISRMSNPFGWTGRRIRDVSTFSPNIAGDVKDLFGGGFDYAIVTSYGYAARRNSRTDASSLALYSRLETEGRLVATITPGKDRSEIPYALDDLYTPFWHLWERERPGPTVKIYELRRHP